MPGLMLAYLFSTQLVCGASFSAAELLGGKLIIFWKQQTGIQPV